MSIGNTQAETFTDILAILARRRLSSAKMNAVMNSIMSGLIALNLASVVVAQEAKVTTVRTQELAGMPGREATMLTVEYPPGGSSAEHRHNANVLVYVLEGSVVMQVKGGKEVTLGPGQTFYESPEDVHTVSRNASKTKPAKFMVFFVKDKGTPLTVPAK